MPAYEMSNNFMSADERNVLAGGDRVETDSDTIMKADEENVLVETDSDTTDEYDSDEGVAAPIGKMEMSFNIEILRMIGNAGVVIMLLVGRFLTRLDMEETFIFKLFHFNHSCTYIDFNPAKSAAALVVMVHILPICLYVVMHYKRVQAETDTSFNNYKMANKILSPITFFCTLYFFMVFVNSPDKDFEEDGAMGLFVMHYIPYMFWQFGMMVMSIQQCWYLVLKDAIPFDFVTCKWLWGWCIFLFFYFIGYTVFVWSFILKHPVWNTETDIGNAVALAIMWGFNVFYLIIPTIFSFKLWRNGSGDYKIVINEVLPTVPHESDYVV